MPPSWFGPRGYAIPTGLAFAITGALIATKARANPIGTIVCAASLFISVQSVVGAFVIWSVGGKQDFGLASGIAENLLEWVWIPPIASLGVVLALFPDGRLLSRRWGTWLVAGLFGVGVFLLSSVTISPFEYYRRCPTHSAYRGRRRSAPHSRSGSF
jgi:hypothetical protein